MKNIILLIVAFFFVSCGGGGGGGDSTVTIEEKTYDASVLSSDEYSSLQWIYTILGLENVYYYNTAGSSSTSSISPKTVSTANGYIGYNNGNPIIVQVVDDGIEIAHEDLDSNISLVSSYNANNESTDPTPSNLYENQHGTAVAGVIGAIGYNNIGLKGVAPSSNLAGFALEVVNGYFIIDLDTLEKAWVTGSNANNIAISNNSWGSCISNDTDAEDLLKQGTELLRDGKGRVYLFAGGNGREGDSDCPNGINMATSNTSYLNNSQYSIAVAAVGSDNKVTNYSSPGANILVSGYSGDDDSNSGISTTVPEGTGNSNYTFSDDTDLNYTTEFSGTSASTPIVAGSLALVLEACPSLSYRDIKYLIAKNSTRVDTQNSSWVQNAASLWHSNDYGFGVINPKSMIDECKSTYTLLGSKQSIITADSTTSAITTSTLTKNLTISQDIIVEWVGLTITSNFNSPESLQVNLISPNGTKSELIHFNNQTGSSVSSYLTSGFRLSSQAFIGESSMNGANGVWQVEITSNKSSASGDVTALSLEIVGH